MRPQARNELRDWQVELYTWSLSVEYVQACCMLAVFDSDKPLLSTN